MDKLSYALGVVIANNLKGLGVNSLETADFSKAIDDVLKGQQPDTVECHYEGRLIDGTVFDSSYKRGQTATFGLNQVIKGWTEGVQLMAEGAKYRLFIPYNLAYGTQGAGQQIPPYAALVFDIELVKVK